MGVGGSDRYTVQTTVAGLSHQFSHDSQRKTPGNPIDQLGESPIPSDKSKPVSEEKHRSPSAGTQEHCSMEPQSASPVMWRAGSSPVALQQVWQWVSCTISVRVSRCRVKANARSTFDKATPITKHPHRSFPSFGLLMLLKGLSYLYLPYILKYMSILCVYLSATLNPALVALGVLIKIQVPGP